MTRITSWISLICSSPASSLHGNWKDMEKKKEEKERCEQDSNLRGETPLDFKSNALTTRPSQLTWLNRAIISIYSGLLSSVHYVRTLDGKGVTHVEGGASAVLLGSLWKSSSDKYGIKGVRILKPLSRQMYRTLRATAFCSSSSP